MKKFIIYLCLFSAIKADSQNLVLNPSFEDTIACPTTTAIPMQCEYWYTANIGSPDYFSEQPDIFCGTSPVPLSNAGYQYARTGIAYVGLGTFVSSIFPNGINRREYIGGELSDTLKQGHEYCVSFYISVAEELKYVTDGIGLYLSIDSAVDYTINTNLPFVPQISNPSGNIIYDTLNWVQISGTYIANGGEKYFTIGNFKDDANTLIDSINNNVPQSRYVSYLFIDDVSVIDCTVGISEVNDNLSSGKLYPNPANTVVYYEDNLNDIEKGIIQLQDISGRNLKEYNLKSGVNRITISVSDLAKGIYMVKIKINGRADENKKLLIQ
ncbi:MAG TPA: T9SS type A sorting domain-containing protein [Bacteroidia bacterium]|nr:T9SS type A sorting domain-containing protein [Bacteroidia bacterium]